jgi:hypothetical protein
MSMTLNRNIQIMALGLNLFFAGAILAFPDPAACEVRLLKSQTVYVPVYSHIYHGDKERPIDLAVTLSIRNTDPDHPITLVSVDYFDSDGKRIRGYLESELKLGELSSTRYVVRESDQSGGSGAIFIVRWKSDAKVTPPIVETVMISTRTQQGISFTSRGQSIKEDNP